MSGIEFINNQPVLAIGASGGGGSSLTAGNGITITTDAINANIDGSTITINGSNQLVASGVITETENSVAGNLTFTNAAATIYYGRILANATTGTLTLPYAAPGTLIFLIIDNSIGEANYTPDSGASYLLTPITIPAGIAATFQGTVIDPGFLLFGSQIYADESNIISDGAGNLTAISFIGSGAGLTNIPYQSQTIYSVYAAGTNATLATTTSAALSFGTTSPTLTISTAGTYLMFAQVNLQASTATFTTQTITLKLRRTNNTPADLANATITITPPAATGLSGEMGVINIPLTAYTTAATTDSISIFGVVSAGVTGSVIATQANILAQRIA